MKPKKNSIHYLNLELSDDEYDKLSQLALRDSRSRTNYVLIILRRHLYEAFPPNKETPA